MRTHKAADLFPLFTENEMRTLVGSMRLHGFDPGKPVLRQGGLIVDGRNRVRAAELAGVEPVYRDLPADVDPWAESWKQNGARRDLEQDRKGAIYVEIVDGSAKHQRDRARRASEANRARSEAARGNQNASKSPTKNSPVSRDTAPYERPDRRERTELARAAGVSPATMSRVLALPKDKRAEVAAGTIRATEALRQIKREMVAQTVGKLPSSTYRIIYADPPWQYNDSRAGLDGYSATAAADHYPTMSVAELSALDVRALADENAVLFCWATFPLLPDALEVVRAWGFKYKTAFVWAKGRPNFGHYHDASAELLMVCTRGSGVPDIDKRERQVQMVERTGRHSAKPDTFRKMIDRLYTAGRRIELFRRGGAIEGWETWGNETTSGAS